MIQDIEKTRCTGCKMCADICPNGAITFSVDEEGFWYPSVNEKCTKCGLCINTCPSLKSNVENENPPQVFSAWSKDDEVRITSTSGGLFWEIAYRFIKDGGVVVGCSYNDDMRSAKHIVARNEEELLCLKGSKYFQSDTSGIYRAVKDELISGKKVLFCGTPCQISAIKAYLSKKYENLYCMDFICRSINSPKAFKAYIDELEKEYGSRVINVQLKNKDRGWQSLASKITFEDGQEYLKDKNEDLWVQGFIMNDLYTRDSCYDCQYRSIPRLNSDITIGDFWGIKDQDESDMFKGISVLLINSDKGKQLIDSCEDFVELQRHSLDEVIPGNPALLNNPGKGKKKEKFFELLNTHSFSYSVNKCIKKSVLVLFFAFLFGCFRFCFAGLKILFLKAKYCLDSDVSITKYIYFNYFSRKIVRKNGARLIPYKGTVLNLAPGSRIILDGKDLLLNTEKLKGSHAECLVRLEKNSIWNCNNGGYLFYNTVLELKPNAVFNSGYFSANGGSVIVIHKNADFGEDVMIGRNVIIYDSDFHSIMDSNGFAINSPQKVTIEDHVWLTSNIIVQKGVTIGEGSLISAYTTVNKDVPPKTIYGGKSVGGVIRNRVEWSRESCPV